MHLGKPYSNAHFGIGKTFVFLLQLQLRVINIHLTLIILRGYLLTLNPHSKGI